MSLTASMWTGVSGLLGHGEKMNVLGNNIANVNTLGFKSQRMDFEDFMYANAFSANGLTQIGRGSAIGAVMGDFSQGAFETTTEATDLAIGGRGFFKVSPPGSDTAFYTRAGNFRFASDGSLNDPHGYTLQGWKIDNTSGPNIASGGANPTANTSDIKGSGVPTDIRLDTWTVPPLQTSKVSMITNLAADAADNSRNAENPFASLIQAWDGSQPRPNNKPAITEGAYAYPGTIKVFDEAGVQHTLTVYYDKVDPSTYEGKDGEVLWEFMVTMNPAEDQRQVWDNGATPPGLTNVKDTKMAGVLMSGTLTFNKAGNMTNQTAYTLQGNIPYAKDANGNPVADANYRDDGNGNLVPIVNNINSAQGITNSLFPASVSQSGFPMLSANFTGAPGAQTTASPNGKDYLIEMDLGLKISNFTTPWSDTASLGSKAKPGAVVNQYFKTGGSGGPGIVAPNPNFGIGGPPVPAANTWPYLATTKTTGGVTVDPATTTFDPTNPAHLACFTNNAPDATKLGFVTPPVIRQPNCTTSFAGSSSTQYASQNGYSFGDLTSWSVDSEGVLSGVYSNGVTLPLYQVCLYDFVCTQGLRREGGNLYSQTRDSGEPQSGAPKISGMGNINSNSLEQSNVDLSREFVLMITTQRGFQSNSKVITTTDTMLETVIQMKR